VLKTKPIKAEGKITLPQQDGFQILDVGDIFFCKADDNYTEIYLEKKKIVVSKTLKYFEDALQPYPFARIHKSYLVNVAEVVKYKKGKGGRSEEHTSELQSRENLVCRLLLEKKNN